MAADLTVNDPAGACEAGEARMRLHVRRARLEDLARKAEARLRDAEAVLAPTGRRAPSPRIVGLYERRAFIYKAMLDTLADELDTIEEAA